MREAEEIWRDLFRLSAAVEKALGSLGVAASKAREALALLDEARSWLGVGPRVKPRETAAASGYPWPESLRFGFWIGLDACLKRLGKLTRSSKVKANFSGWELTKAARGFAIRGVARVPSRARASPPFQPPALFADGPAAFFPRFCFMIALCLCFELFAKGTQLLVAKRAAWGVAECCGVICS